MAGSGSVACPGSSASTLGPSRGLVLGTALGPVFGRVVGCPLKTASTSGDVPAGRSEATS